MPFDPFPCRRSLGILRPRVMLVAVLLGSFVGTVPAEAAMASTHAGSWAEGAAFTFELPRVDSAMVTLLVCLLGVPMVTATIAFLVVEVSMRPAQPSTWETSSADAYPAGAMLSGRSAVSRLPVGGSVPHFGVGGSRVSLPGPRRAPFLGSPTYASANTANTITDTPSLPGTSVAPPVGNGGYGGGYGGGCGSIFGASTTADGSRLGDASKLGNGEKPLDVSRVSPLSTALLVKNPAGATIRIDGDLAPHPQQTTVNVISVKDNTAVLCVHINEAAAGGPASIRVETKAKSIPVAMLDTRRAVFSADGQPPAFEQRCVVLHRVGGDDGSDMGPACAWISPSGQGRFSVHYLMGEPGAALTVCTTAGGRVIESVVDAQAQVVARREGATDALWVRQGVDIALMVCVAVALQKLRS